MSDIKTGLEHTAEGTDLERDGGDGVALGVGGPRGRRGRVQHTHQRLPLVQADGVPNEQYLLPLPSAQQLLPVEPAGGEYVVNKLAMNDSLSERD